MIDQLRSAESMFEDFSRANPKITFAIEYERYAEGASYVRKIYEFLGEELADEEILKTLN